LGKKSEKNGIKNRIKRKKKWLKLTYNLN